MLTNVFSWCKSHLQGVGALHPWPAVLSMSFNNTSQQDEAALPLPSFPPPAIAPPAVEQPAQLEGAAPEEPPAAPAAPQADSLSSPSPAPELIQPPPPTPPPLEPHLSGPPGPEPKVPAVSSATWTGPGPRPAVLSALLMLSTRSLHDLPTPCDSPSPLCASGPQRMCDKPVRTHHSGPGEQKDWCI